jgi:hypothetical protein
MTCIILGIAAFLLMCMLLTVVSAVVLSKTKKDLQDEGFFD